MQRFGIRSGLTGLTLLLLSACVASDGSVSSSSGNPGLKVGVEKAETAYLSRADGPYMIPAVPLEKFPEGFRRQSVAYSSDMPPGSVVIHPGQKVLYFITGKNKAIRYGISVGRAGFEWAGEAVVSETKHWPTWTPPAEMIERDPKLAKWEKGQPGGPTNPLGARAIYLLTNGRDYGYRIHGTPDWWSIGRNASSGCIRMIQQDVIDLHQRIQPGARVLVLNADGSVPAKLKLPPPAPKKAKPKAVEPMPVAAPIAEPVADPAAAPVTTPAIEPIAAPGASLPAPSGVTAVVPPAAVAPQAPTPTTNPALLPLLPGTSTPTD